MRSSFVVGSLPLSLSLTSSQLRLISTLGMGVLVGTSLIVIVPEGVETLYSSMTMPSYPGSVSPPPPPPGVLDHRWQPKSVPTVNFLDDRSLGDTLTIKSLPNDGGFQSKPAKGEVHILSEKNPDPKGPPPEEPPPMGPPSKRPPPGGSPPPDAQHDHHPHDAKSPHAWIGIALVGGFILMYLIDKLPHVVNVSLPKRQPRPYHISLDNLGSALSRGASPGRVGGLLDPGSPSTFTGHGFSTTMGLVIHAAADGIALGASTSNTNLSFIIFIAIIIHKAPASFGLTSVLLQQGLSTRAARAHLLIFSLAAPVGAVLTWLFSHTVLAGYPGDEASTHWKTGVLLLFSAGTFL